MTTSVSNLVVFGDPDPGAVDQIEKVMQHERAVKGALMADHHLGYSMPIGGVVAYDGAISPTGVGFDIACGNMAVKTNLNVTHIGLGIDDPEGGLMTLTSIMREIQRQVSFGMGRSNPKPVDDPVLDPNRSTWEEIERQFGTELHEKAVRQLGTVGSGNHYVDLLYDGEGNLWVANHFGSRGLGHTLASGFMAAAAGLSFTDRVPETEDAVVLNTDTALGEFYIAAMHLAGHYAYAGREYVTQQVLDILGAEAVETVHNHHNFAWYEDGLWVVRKGATPLTGAPAYIGGSMGEGAAIVRGLGPWNGEQLVEPFDIGAINSAPHGAGRVMSRTQAAGKMRKMWVCTTRNCNHPQRAQAGNGRNVVLDDGTIMPLGECPGCGSRNMKKVRMRDTSSAAIDWTATRQELTARGIVVLGAGADEAPGVYKNLWSVLAAHSNIEILTKLWPLGVVMAGPDEYDPYQD